MRAEWALHLRTVEFLPASPAREYLARCLERMLLLGAGCFGAPGNLFRKELHDATLHDRTLYGPFAGMDLILRDARSHRRLMELLSTPVRVGKSVGRVLRSRRPPALHTMEHSSRRSSVTA